MLDISSSSERVRLWRSPRRPQACQKIMPPPPLDSLLIQIAVLWPIIYAAQSPPSIAQRHACNRLLRRCLDACIVDVCAFGRPRRPASDIVRRQVCKPSSGVTRIWPSSATNGGATEPANVFGETIKYNDILMRTASAYRPTSIANSS